MFQVDIEAKEMVLKIIEEIATTMCWACSGIVYLSGMGLKSKAKNGIIYIVISYLR